MAVVARFPDDEDQEMLQAYRQGQGVDCVGGAEAIISHLVTAGESRLSRTYALLPLTSPLPPLQRAVGVPALFVLSTRFSIYPSFLRSFDQSCKSPARTPRGSRPSTSTNPSAPSACGDVVRAPPMSIHTKTRTHSFHARSCGEELGYTFLSCVLANLHRAPLLVPGRHSPLAHDGRPTLWSEDVSAIVAPASACGGPAVLSLLGRENGRRTLLVVRGVPWLWARAESVGWMVAGLRAHTLTQTHTHTSTTNNQGGGGERHGDAGVSRAPLSPALVGGGAGRPRAIVLGGHGLCRRAQGGAKPGGAHAQCWRHPAACLSRREAAAAAAITQWL